MKRRRSRAALLPEPSAQSPSKVLMTADAVGGVWTYALELCAELGRRKTSAVLAVMGPRPNAAQRAEAASIPSLSMVEAPFRLEWMSDPWADVDRARDWLCDLADRHRVDLVHLNGYCHGAADWGRPVLTVAHSCVCSWWRAVHGCGPPREWDEYRRRVAAGLRASAHVVAPTRAFRDELRRSHPFTTPCSVIHNARSPRRFACAETARREPFILASGRLWDEAKNMRVLDEAVRDIGWPTFVAGDSAAPEGAQFAATSLWPLGRLPEAELASWLKRTSIYVHPAKYEPFGLSVVEAALAGCALVLADLPTLRELWDGAALFANPHDPAELRACIERLIADPDLRTELARAARRRAERFCPEAMGRAYYELYRDLLERRSAGDRRPAAGGRKARSARSDYPLSAIRYPLPPD